MPKTISPPQCLTCHFATYTGGQIGYAEQHGTPLEKSCAIYCQIRREYVFKDFVCNNYTEKHEEPR